MLTLEETGLALNFFKIFSILNILPIEVDVKNGKIQKQSNQVKVFTWKILFGVSIAHSIYTFGRLVQSTILEPEKYFRWDHFALHFGLAFVSPVCHLTGYRLFVKNAEENVIIFNQLFSQREDPVQKIINQQLRKPAESGNGNPKPGSAAANKTTENSGVGPSSGQLVEECGNEVIGNLFGSRSRFGWPPQYALDEQVAQSQPLSAVYTVVFVVLFLAMDPSRCQLLYSSLPPEYQNIYSFLSLLAIEALNLAIVFFTCCFAVVTQILFFGKCQFEFEQISLQLRNLREKFQNGNQDIRREIWILRQILGEIKQLVVLLELFNRCFPFCIVAWKNYTLSICIVFTFFVIRYFEEFPILAAFLGYSATIMAVIYVIMYGNAFSIPDKMEELKNDFLLTAQKTASNPNVSKTLRLEMKSEIKRIRNVGIQVGNFQQMERESTLNFIDFVFSQVADLLVTFPA